MPSEDCPKFEGCSAPLCPLETGKDGIWYTDEEICNRKEYQKLKWIKKQKQIAKIKNISPDYYFTIPMLESIKRLSKSIEGINPDMPLDKAKQAEQKWVEDRISGGNKKAINAINREITRVGVKVKKKA